MYSSQPCPFYNKIGTARKLPKVFISKFIMRDSQVVAKKIRSFVFRVEVIGVHLKTILGSEVAVSFRIGSECQ